MKRHTRLFFEEILEEQKKTNRLLEQVIKSQALLGNQQAEMHMTIKKWWGTDLAHHKEENVLLEKVVVENSVKSPS